MRLKEKVILNQASKYARRSNASFKISYSQCGEDLIIQYVMRILGIRKPSYVDVGAYDPIKLSNTYLFYQNGSRGICIEPNIELCNNIARVRTGDKCLNVGVSSQKGNRLDFYVMDPPTLSTFNREEAERMSSFPGHKIVDRKSVPVELLNDIIDDHLENPPDIISLDVEGEDLSILEEFDFTRCRPTLWCIETVRYDPHRGTKDSRFDRLMEDRGYFCYSNTFVNSIYLDKQKWGQVIENSK